MLILFNGLMGYRRYRVLVFLIDGDFWLFRPYVGYFRLVGDFSWIA